MTYRSEPIRPRLLVFQVEPVMCSSVPGVK